MVVIAGLDPAIHPFRKSQCEARWMRGSSPRMTSQGSAIWYYASVIDKADGSYSAYVPDLPGCVATGDSIECVEREIRNAIRFHVQGLEDDGLPVSQPTSIAE